MKRNYLLTLLCLLVAVSANAELRTQTVERFNGTTTFSGTNLNNVSNGVYTNSANHVTFEIDNVKSYSSSRLEYDGINYASTKVSNFSWLVESGYDVELTSISCQVRGYCTSGGSAYAQFSGGTRSDDCQTTSTGTGGAKTVSVTSDTPLSSPISLTLTAANRYVNTSFTIHDIAFTYKVTQDVPVFQYKSIAYGSEGGNVYSSLVSFGAATAAEAISEAYDADITNTSTGLAQTAYFKAVPATGYVFVGWKENADDAGYVSTSAEYSEELTSYSNDDAAPATITRYAVFSAKNTPLFSGSNQTLNVGANQVTDFAFQYTSSSVPSADTNSDFYYSIGQTPDATTKEGCADATQVVSYDPATNTLVGLNSGTAVITFTHKETADYYSASQSFEITVNKNTGTLTNDLGSAYKIDDVLDLAACYTASNSEVEVQVASSNTDVIAVVEGKLKAVGVGAATVTFSQEETYKWTALSASQEISVSKYDMSATISQATATWDATISNPFAISYSLNDFTVETLDPAIATYADGAIQTYAETGTARFLISRPEDYKYNQLAETLSISVAPAQESCYVLEDNTEYKVGDGTNKQGVNFEWEGAAAKLSVLVHRQDLGYGGFTITAYFGDGTSTPIKSMERGEIPTSYGDTPIEVDIPEGVNKVNLAADGALNKYFTNLKITRAPYFSPSEANKTMESTIGTDATGTIQVQYNSCGATVKVVSNNPKITVSPTSFWAEGSGTQTITLTGDGSELGTETATITIYDQSQKTTLNVTSTITRIPQTITWNNSFENLDVFSTVTLDATASGGTEVTYSIAEGDGGKASIAGNVLSFNEAGTVRVVASAAQSDIYETASDMASVVVSLAQPVVSTLPSVDPVVYGTALTDAMLQGGVAMYGGTAVAGAFAWADEEITDGLTPKTYSFNVRFTPADETHYSTADCTVDVTITKAPQTIAWNNSFENLDVFSTVTLDATASGGTEVTYSIAEEDKGKASVTGNVLSFNEAGTVRVVASAAQSDIYETASDMASVVVSLAQPVVSTLPSVDPVVYGTALTDAMLQGGVAKYGETVVEGAFAWADEEITDGLTPKTYSFNVRFTPTDETRYSTADCTVEVTITKAPQTITWSNSFENLDVFSTVTLDATASGGTEVTYLIAEEDKGKASIAGNVLSFNEAGAVRVVASAAQSEIYDTASDTVSVVVSLAKPVVSTLPSVDPVVYGTALTDAMLQGGVAKYGETAVEGAFAWADEEITDGLTPNTYSFNVRFTPTDGTRYSTADCTVEVTITKAPQTIAWNNSFENLNVQSEVALSATAQTAVTFEVSDSEVATITDNLLTFLKAGTINIVAIAAESEYYQKATDTIKGIVIDRIDPVVSQWPSATLTYGETLADVVLAGESANEGTFQWGERVSDEDYAAVKTAGTYTYEVKFVPADGERYNTLYGEATITIKEATQVITWENAPTECKVGDRIALAAVASSGLAVDYFVDQIGNYAMIDAENNELVALAKGSFQLRVSQAGEAGKYLAAEDLVMSINIEAGNTTATEQVAAPEQASVRKIMRDGVLYILRDGQCYDTCGRLVRIE